MLRCLYMIILGHSSHFLVTLCKLSSLSLSLSLSLSMWVSASVGFWRFWGCCCMANFGCTRFTYLWFRLLIDHLRFEFLWLFVTTYMGFKNVVFPCVQNDVFDCLKLLRKEEDRSFFNVKTLQTVVIAFFFFFLFLIIL